MSTLSLLLCCCLALPTICYRLKRATGDCGIDGESPGDCRPSQVCVRPPICGDPCMFRCAGRPHNKPNSNGDPTTTVPPPLCGQSAMPPPSPTSSTPVVSIVGGQTAPVGAIPWQVGLGFTDKNKRYLVCGGSYVLNSRNEVKVITAAHCVKWRSGRKYFVLFGMHDRKDGTGVVQVTAHSIVSHPAYSSTYHSSDIAIISFNRLDFNDLAGTHASPICLVSTGYTDGEMAMVSGWGLTAEYGSGSQLLQYLNVQILDYTDCNTETGNAGKLDSTMMCAFADGQGPCHIDSGGALAVYRDNQWQLAGLVSWGVGCARANYPAVYADVNTLISWIEDNL